MFLITIQSKETIQCLLTIKQSNLSFAEYSVNFHLLAAERGWGDSTLQAAFFRGFSDSVNDEMAARDESEFRNNNISLYLFR